MPLCHWVCSVKSDHAPLLIELQRKKLKKRPFRFVNYWADWEGFDEVVDLAWSKEVKGNPLYIFVKKLENAKRALKSWAKEKANIPTLLVNNRKKYEVVCRELRKAPLDPKLIEKEKEIKNIIYDLEKAEEKFVWQRSRKRWINDGERNTKLYHSAVKRREASNAIS